MANVERVRERSKMKKRKEKNSQKPLRAIRRKGETKRVAGIDHSSFSVQSSLYQTDWKAIQSKWCNKIEEQIILKSFQSPVLPT